MVLKCWMRFSGVCGAFTSKYRVYNVFVKCVQELVMVGDERSSVCVVLG